MKDELERWADSCKEYLLQVMKAHFKLTLYQADKVCRVKERAGRQGTLVAETEGYTYEVRLAPECHPNPANILSRWFEVEFSYLGPCGLAYKVVGHAITTTGVLHQKVMDGSFYVDGRFTVNVNTA